MGNFISKAFITIRDKIKQKEIINQMVYMGYSYQKHTSGITMYTRRFDDESFVLLTNNSLLRAEGYIDCNFYANGDEELAVKLFLELAGMQRFKDTNQWFKRITADGIEYVKHSQDLIDRIGVRAFNRDCFPLTPIELAVAVQQGKIKLN